MSGFSIGPLVPLQLIPPSVTRKIFHKVDKRSFLNILQTCSSLKNFLLNDDDSPLEFNLEDQVLEIWIRERNATIRTLSEKKTKVFWNGELTEEATETISQFHLGKFRFAILDLKGDLIEYGIDEIVKFLETLRISCEFVDFRDLAPLDVQKISSVLRALEVELRLKTEHEIPSGKWHSKIGPRKFLFYSNGERLRLMDYIQEHREIMVFGVDNEENLEEFCQDIRNGACLGKNQTTHIGSLTKGKFWKECTERNGLTSMQTMIPDETRENDQRAELHLVPRKKGVIGVISTYFHWRLEGICVEMTSLSSVEDLLYFLGFHVFQRHPIDFSGNILNGTHSLNSFEDLFHM